MNKKFNLSKGSILQKISPQLNVFKVPITKLYSTRDWLDNKEKVIHDIVNFFSIQNSISLIAIRSSSMNEDKINNSNAGYFYSELNVNSSNKLKIKNAINKVIKSFKRDKKTLKNFFKNEVIIQEMIVDSSISGVVFTYDLNTGAPYYLINYDDVSGLTDTVTSGKSKFSNKSLVISRHHISKLRSKRFIKIIEAVKELEIKIQNSYLDIEFVLTNKGDIYLLQVRTLNIKNKWNLKREQNFKVFLDKIEKKIKKTILKKNKNVLGSKTIYGQMPDWNPAEIIGSSPRKLSYSLYKKLITNRTWKKARSLMGYKEPGESNLMLSFGGQPYIDVRLSLNSFLPKKLSNKISTKLVNHWVKKLSLNPVLHDKIEFDLAITCFSFDIKNKIKELTSNSITTKEKKIYIKYLKDSTNNIISGNGFNDINKLQKELENLEKIKYDFYKPTLSSIKKNVFYCIKYGTLIFSILARHAFIGKTILLSLNKIRIIDEKKTENFFQNIKTITTEFLKDFQKINTSTKNKKLFLKKYGHLRPGTYNIMSKRYDQEKYLGVPEKYKKKSEKNKLPLTKKDIDSINKILKINKLYDHSANSILEYISKSISSREYSKFQFTKLLSLTIEQIYYYGKNFGLSRDQLSYLSYDDIITLHKKKKSQILKTIKRNKEDFIKTSFLKLPQLIIDSSAAYISPFQANKPNFVTKKKIIERAIFLEDAAISKKINNKIVLIESADPGYDWIFSHKIKGLITKYGGSNSHMSIRCNELMIPAAIGCGEQIFNKLKNVPKIQIDCDGGLVKSILE